jgi:hypothetical protein
MPGSIRRRTDIDAGGTLGLGTLVACAGVVAAPAEAPAILAELNTLGLSPEGEEPAGLSSGL